MRPGFAFALGALLLVVGCKFFESKGAAEGTYTGELLACTAAAKAHHPDPADKAAGLAESKACECSVDKKWGVQSDC